MWMEKGRTLSSPIAQIHTLQGLTHSCYGLPTPKILSKKRMIPCARVIFTFFTVFSLTDELNQPMAESLFSPSSCSQVTACRWYIGVQASGFTSRCQHLMWLGRRKLTYGKLCRILHFVTACETGALQKYPFEGLMVPILNHCIS